VDHAVKACQVLKDAGIEFTLILIGDGREREKLLSLAEDLGIEKSVVFAGNRSQHWIAGTLNRAHLALAPLTGRALLEIALSGCPVIAYDVDWHAEIVRTGDTGFLVENLNEKKLGEAALEILQDESKRLQMGQNIRNLAMEMASPEVIIRKQVEIYQRLTA
jgi:glycosyltransferase involved in cell wall biosynthesis